MAKTAYESVAQYLLAQPPELRALLEKVRTVIRKALPEAEEIISYQIPAYKWQGKPVLYFAGWKEHFSLYPASAALVKALSARLGGVEISKGTLRFPLTGKLPTKLISDIARFRASEVQASQPKKKKPTRRPAASSSVPRRTTDRARRSPKARPGSARATR